MLKRANKKGKRLRKPTILIAQPMRESYLSFFNCNRLSSQVLRAKLQERQIFLGGRSAVARGPIHLSLSAWATADLCRNFGIFQNLV